MSLFSPIVSLSSYYQALFCSLFPPIFLYILSLGTSVITTGLISFFMQMILKYLTLIITSFLSYSPPKYNSGNWSSICLKSNTSSLLSTKISCNSSDKSNLKQLKWEKRNIFPCVTMRTLSLIQKLKQCCLILSLFSSFPSPPSPSSSLPSSSLLPHHPLFFVCVCVDFFLSVGLPIIIRSYYSCLKH